MARPSPATPTPPAGLSRRDPAVASILRAWRRLTTPQTQAKAGPGQPTLLACSGGADSCALVLALATAGPKVPFTIAHIVHDLRPRADCLADRGAVAALAARLDLPFVQAEVKVKALPGNAEANARRVRYKALATLARAHGLAYIATAHHAHDQLETVLMAFLRGGGPAGLRGIAASRPLGSGITLIRPMLGISPDDARRLCRVAGWEWREDGTNADTTRLRAALRVKVIPELLRIRRSAPARAAATAQMAAWTAELIDRATAALPGHAWDRNLLRGTSPAVVGAILRREADRLASGRAADRVGWKHVSRAVQLIKSDDTDPHTLNWRGVTVHIDAHRVLLAAASS